MCYPDKPGNRRGCSPDDGIAHAEDHQVWTRRTFMQTLGLGATAGFAWLSGTPVHAFARTGPLDRLGAIETDRVLVLVQLGGGNDGLNTIVPFRNDTYYQARPSIALPEAELALVSPDLGLHPALAPLAPRYADGNVAILQQVGYPSASLSHFRSTDLWLTGGDGTAFPTSGLGGRFVESAFPADPGTPPTNPLAVQLGGTSALLMQGNTAQHGVAIRSLELFDRIESGAELFTTTGLPEAAFGAEMGFVRSVTNDSFQYAEAIRTASAAGSNSGNYPGNNNLADQLAIVARLVRGNLGSRIYHVYLGGFDTHSNQLAAHNVLMTRLSGALTAFFDDLSSDGTDRRVMLATFSEFGRRVAQNGSEGTDHGTSAPIFVVGPGTAGGLYGASPDLDDLDGGGNLRFATDYRSVFGTLMADWFGLPPQDVDAVLGGAYPTLGFVDSVAGTGIGSPVPPATFRLGAPYPNPFADRLNIPIEVDVRAALRLELVDVLGRPIHVVLDRTMAPGTHNVSADLPGLAAGTYFLRLTGPGHDRTVPVVRVH